jgi:Lrp/AsnC family leucine-responsive transcriptional regulator
MYIACMEIDAIDNRILSILQTDGRISNQDLAERVGLSPSPCLRRVKAMEARGIVQQYVALVDPSAVGQGLQAVV